MYASKLGEMNIISLVQKCYNTIPIGKVGYIFWKIRKRTNLVGLNDFFYATQVIIESIVMFSIVF